MILRFITRLRRAFRPVRQPVVPNSTINPWDNYGSWSRGYHPPVYPAGYKKPATGGSVNRQVGAMENA